MNNKPLSAEARRKISEAKMGKKHSPEAKAKMKASITDERRKKMSDGMIAYWEKRRAKAENHAER